MGGIFSAPSIDKPKTKPEKESEEAKARERQRRKQQKMLSTSIFAGRGGSQLGQAPVSRPTISGS